MITLRIGFLNESDKIDYYTHYMDKPDKVSLMDAAWTEASKIGSWLNNDWHNAGLKRCVTVHSVQVVGR
jgi:hypothetical protein